MTDKRAILTYLADNDDPGFVSLRGMLPAAMSTGRASDL